MRQRAKKDPNLAFRSQANFAGLTDDYAFTCKLSRLGLEATEKINKEPYGAIFTNSLFRIELHCNEIFSSKFYIHYAYVCYIIFKITSVAYLKGYRALLNVNYPYINRPSSCVLVY